MFTMQTLAEKTLKYTFFILIVSIVSFFSFSASVNPSELSVASTAHAQGAQQDMVNEQGQCIPYLRDFIKQGTPNDSLEVLKLQSFLKTVEGYDAVPLSGEYGAATEAAVRDFQIEYADEVLTPWGYAADAPTGHVYITTRNKINEILCGQDISLTRAQQQEITAYRNRIAGGGVAGNQTVAGSNDNTQNNRGGAATPKATDDTDTDVSAGPQAGNDQPTGTTATSTTTPGTTTVSSPARQAAATVYTSVNSLFGSMLAFIFSWNFLFLLIGILIGLIISPYTHAEPAEVDTGSAQESS